MENNNKIDYRLNINNKQILQICLPIAAAILVPQLNFITNNIFLGHLGEEWLAVAGITGVYYLIFAVVGNGLNNCLQMLISRKAGENNVQEIGSIFWQGIRIAIVLALIGIAITLFITPTILKLVLHNANNVAYATSFLNIRIWGLLFLYLYQMRNALLVGTNNANLLIYGTAAEAIANVVLDYGFIFGKLGLPNLGFNGAAWASVVAEALGLFVIFIVIKYKGIGKQLNLFANKHFDAAISKNIFIKSLPLIGQYLISIMSWEFFYILIEHKGTEASAISNVMRNVFGFFGCITWAFAATSNTMVSNIIGQGLQHRVLELVYKITKLSFGFAFAVFVLLNIFPTIFLSVFGQTQSFVIHAIPVLRVVSIAMLLMSISTVWLNAITGTGNTKINLAIELVTIIAYCSYVYIVLEKLNKSVTWGWGSEWVYWITMFIPAFWYMHSGRWQKKIV